MRPVTANQLAWRARGSSQLEARRFRPAARCSAAASNRRRSPASSGRPRLQAAHLSWKTTIAAHRSLPGWPGWPGWPGRPGRPSALFDRPASDAASAASISTSVKRPGQPISLIQSSCQMIQIRLQTRNPPPSPGLEVYRLESPVGTSRRRRLRLEADERADRSERVRRSQTMKKSEQIRQKRIEECEPHSNFRRA